MMRLTLWLALAIGAQGAEITVFSFDDGTVPFRRNLVLTMMPATKHPSNPVLPRGGAGTPDAQRAQFYGSVIRVGAKFRMWYTAESRPTRTHNSADFRPAYAESRDGIHWEKPDLGLVEFNGNRKNNLLLFSPPPRFDLTEPLASFVLYEPDDPAPARRFKMALYGRYFEYSDKERKTAKATFYPYFSADGLRWTLATPPPKGPTYDETEVPFPVRSIFEIGGLYRFGGLYHVAGQEDAWSILLPSGKPGARVMTTHWSKDFVHWSQDRALSFVRYGYRSSEDLDEAHEPAAVWNRGNVLLATYGLWQGAKDRKERRMPLGLLISNDGIHFREPQPDFVFLPPGETGAWDQHGLLHGQGFENVGQETYVYYGAWDLSAAEDPPGAVGLATMRRDGFGYLSVGAEQGDAMLTTIPLAFPKSKVRITVNASGLGPDACLRVEVLDENGDGRFSAELRQDGVARPLRWKTGETVPGGGLRRLRVHFEGAGRKGIRFYAAYVE
ncbi:MAG: hypothetical protein NTY38_19035 [Acidobacteria bacterium]|nr:hypothetical protein [Acidobacteriota bacterium]